MRYFADTYAIIDYLKGNPVYKKYFTDHEIITTKMNLLEVYYWTLLEETKEKADENYHTFLANTVEVNDETLKQSAQFRFHHKHKKVSYIDALGYQTAQVHKVKFLTGDKAFQSIPNVEFIR